MDLPIWFMYPNLACVGFVIIGLSALEMYKEWRRVLNLFGILMVIMLVPCLWVCEANYVHRSIVLMSISFVMAGIAASENVLGRRGWAKHAAITVFLLAVVMSVFGLAAAVSLPIIFFGTIVLYEIMGFVALMAALCISGVIPLCMAGDIRWHECSPYVFLLQ